MKKRYVLSWVFGMASCLAEPPQGSVNLHLPAAEVTPTPPSEAEKERATLLYEMRDLLEAGSVAQAAAQQHRSAMLAELMELGRECKDASRVTISQARAKDPTNSTTYTLDTKPLRTLESPGSVADFLALLFAMAQYEFEAGRMRALQPTHEIVCAAENGKPVRLVVDDEHGFLQRLTTSGIPVGMRFEVQSGFVSRALAGAE